MKGGVIGVSDYEFGQIESQVATEEIGDGRTLEACIDVRQTETNAFDGNTVQIGQAAVQELDTRQETQIAEGSITVTEREFINTKFTNFVLVPNAFVAVDNSQGTFAFPLISNATEMATIERGEINLKQFEDAHDEASPWQVGFYGRTGEAEKGTLYGPQVLDDEVIGKEIGPAQRNQLGVDLAFNGDDVKVTLAESGYTEIYQPNNYDSIDFAKFVVDEVLPFVEK